MNRGAKIALVLGAGVAAVAGLALLASKSASATPAIKPPLPTDENAPMPEGKPGDQVVVVPDDHHEEPAAPPAVVPAPEGGFIRDQPFAVPGIQDAAEMSRILLRWWAAEGQSLLFADEEPDDLKRQGFPLDFGSGPRDLSEQVWDTRQKWMAAAFRVLSGIADPKITPSKGELTNELVSALRRWEASQALAPFTPPAQGASEVPLNLQAPPMPQAAPPAPAAPLAPVAPPFVPPTIPASMPAAPEPLAAPLPPAIQKLPELPTVPPVPPQAPPAVAANVVPADTAKLVAALLADEASSGWKKISAAVKAWQQSRGLLQDGKFGPKSALVVAGEIGTVPLVRYWPAGSFPEGRWLPDFKAALLSMANAAAEPRATQLRISAEREQGQGFGSKQTALPLSQQIQLAKVA